MSELLDNNKLRSVLGAHAVNADDPAGDGIYALQWRSTETFLRMTEEYVAPEKRAAYRRALEMAFPGKKAVL